MLVQLTGSPTCVHSRSLAAIPLSRKPLGLYVHIPFCYRKCYYCDFAAGPAPQQIREQYVDALLQEIRSSPWKGQAARTVYFGGGTPSELETPQLQRIVDALQDTFRFLPSDVPTSAPEHLNTRTPEHLHTTEWSIECNPRTVTEESLGAMVLMGFNRISLGVQSFHDHHLKAIGRIHDAAEAGEIVFAARRAGFRRVNLDLIFCLPGQTLREWQADVERALELGPGHLSLYNLTVEDKSEFGRRHRLGMLALPDEDLSADMYEWVIDRLAAAGLEQYEVSNFARPGEECRHNRIYWRQEEYLGFGLAAASYLGGARWANTRSMQRYLATAGASPERSLEERLSPGAACGEAIMLGLRTAEGIDLEGTALRYGLPGEAYRKTAVRLIEEGLLNAVGRRVRLTRRGILLANSVCAEFL